METQTKEYKYVNTTKGKYFGVVEDAVNKVIVRNAVDLTTTSVDKNTVALEYIKGTLIGTAKDIEFSSALIESVVEAKDETKLIHTYQELLPDAEKRANGTIVFAALKEML